ncbi:vitamin K epoxide reductase family protein [Aquimarina litoralis]|uniref:vitamin K epoxide reductase family protein n=1 Tax=Aquimarina litoralis TaxID=584605 RepID=UPI001C571D96|nr:vitamin K epoxide reductase family protein [Aquimarina litoralis]
MQNYINTTKKILDLLQVKYTKSYLEDALLSHPENDSLLSISDTLTGYNIKNLAVKLGKNQLDVLSTPSIVQVQTKETTFFYTLKSIKEELVTYFDHNNQLNTTSKQDFLNKWTGVCLMAEKSDLSKEKGIEFKISKKRTLNVILLLVSISILFKILFSLGQGNTLNSFLYNLNSILYLTIKLIGFAIAVTILYFEFDEYNPTLQSLCSGGKKVDCNLVLNSKQATIFYGNIRLSTLGVSYFFASLSYTWIYGLSPSILSWLTNLSLLAIPIVILSVYYQAIIIKRWCKFCIGLQLVLLGEIIISLVSKFHYNSFQTSTLPVFFTLFLTSILVWKLIQPLLLKTKQINLYKRSLKRIKYNKNVFNELLIRSRKVQSTPNELGIRFESKNALVNVIKVCNPYCNPCAQAHPVLEKLLDEGLINLQIIFAVSNNINDPNTHVVKHFLSLKTQPKTLKNTLNTWYALKDKKLQNLTNENPTYQNTSILDQEIQEMSTWCTNEHIDHTPTIFINGYELPREYSVMDLSEILK